MAEEMDAGTIAFAHRVSGPPEMTPPEMTPPEMTEPEMTEPPRAG